MIICTVENLNKDQPKGLVNLRSSKTTCFGFFEDLT